MQDRSIRAGLMPLLWGAVLCLLIAATLLILRQPSSNTPMDAIYVMAEVAR